MLAELVRASESGKHMVVVAPSWPGDDSSLSAFIHFALAAADEAIRSSGWQPQDPAQLERAGVALGGGKFLGQGCYAVSAARYLLGEPVRASDGPPPAAPV